MTTTSKTGRKPRKTRPVDPEAIREMLAKPWSLPALSPEETALKCHAAAFPAGELPEGGAPDPQAKLRRYGR